MQEQLVVNKDILNEASSVSGIKDHSRIVEESIKLFIAFSSQKAIAKLRGKVEWNGNLQELRETRNDND